MMRPKALYVALAMVTAGFSAHAADLKAPVPAVQTFSWSGVYLGAHLGYGWGRTVYTDATLPGWQVVNKPDGIIGGVQLGYNWQSGAWVLGAEAELSATGIGGTTHDVAPFAGDRYTDDLDWTATLVGRAGYAIGQTLLYAKGGAAFARARHEYQWIGTDAVATGRRNASGWTVGGGLEQALAPNWSVRVDYSYIDVGKQDVDLVEPSYAWTAQVKQTVHAVKFGINFRPWP